MNTPQEKLQIILTLILAIFIVVGFLFFHFGKQITGSLSSIFYAYRYIQPSPTYPISPTAPTAPMGPTAPTQPAGPIEIEILSTEPYQIQAGPGEEITIPLPLKNSFSETVKLSRLILGNQQNNNFISEIEKGTLAVQWRDSKGTLYTASLINTNINDSTGYRIFCSSPYHIVLPGRATRTYQIVAKLKDTISVKYIDIELTHIYGYGAFSKTPVESKGSLSATIGLIPGKGYINLETTKSQYNVGEEIILK